tara:strand:+ start:498 stop:1817 length:1320 start_codon:yes stop_codon:yes gene_type:complete
MIDIDTLERGMNIMDIQCSFLDQIYIFEESISEFNKFYEEANKFNKTQKFTGKKGKRINPGKVSHVISDKSIRLQYQELLLKGTKLLDSERVEYKLNDYLSEGNKPVIETMKPPKRCSAEELECERQNTILNNIKKIQEKELDKYGKSQVIEQIPTMKRENYKNEKQLEILYDLNQKLNMILVVTNANEEELGLLFYYSRQIETIVEQLYNPTTVIKQAYSMTGNLLNYGVRSIVTRFRSSSDDLKLLNKQKIELEYTNQDLHIKIEKLKNPFFQRIKDTINRYVSYKLRDKEAKIYELTSLGFTFKVDVDNNQFVTITTDDGKEDNLNLNDNDAVYEKFLEGYKKQREKEIGKLTVMQQEIKNKISKITEEIKEKEQELLEKAAQVAKKEAAKPTADAKAAQIAKMEAARAKFEAKRKKKAARAKFEAKREKKAVGVQ